MSFLTKMFTWWNGSTVGTDLFTRRFGKKVGEDQFGNIYYEGGTSTFGLSRRWVIYNGYADPSTIPPGWHAWMHHRSSTPPPQQSYNAREWEKSHLANQTGTSFAYRPKGSLAVEGERTEVTGDYDAWTPGS